MKKTILVLFIFMLAVCLTVSSSCGIKSENYRNKTIGFSQYHTRSTFYNIIQQTIQEACDEKGINLIVKDSDYNISKQVSDISQFIDSDVDAIIINPVDNDSLALVIAKAREKGIIVITVDNIVSSDIEVDAKICADNFGNALLAGKWLAEQMGGQTIYALYLSGVESSIVSEERRYGLVSGISEYLLDSRGKMQFYIVSRKQSDWTVSGTYFVINGIENENLQYNCLVSEAQSVALTSLKVLKDSNLDGKINYIACATCDTLSTEAMDLIMSGKMASGYQNPYLYGDTAVETIIKLWNGEKVEKEILQPTVLITQKNYFEYFDKNGEHKILRWKSEET